MVEVDREQIGPCSGRLHVTSSQEPPFPPIGYLETALAAQTLEGAGRERRCWGERAVS